MTREGSEAPRTNLQSALVRPFSRAMLNPSLTTLQRELLDVLALDLPDDEIREVKRLLARHFAERAADGFDAFAASRGLTTDDTDGWAFDHRLRVGNKGSGSLPRLSGKGPSRSWA